MSNIYFDFNFNSNCLNYVSIKLKNGLGNKLLQLGVAYSYAINNNKRLVLFDENVYYRYLFDNKIDIITNTNNYDIYNELISNNNTNILLDGNFRSFNNLKTNDNSTRNFLRNLVYSSNNLMYTTYNIYNALKSHFTKINNVLCEDDDIVSIHINVNNNDKIDINYYNNALNIVNRKNVIVFSDNIEWCKKNIIYDNYNIYYSTFYQDEIEFILLSFIKHNILSNSLYGIMASYISYYETKKIIVAPVNNNNTYHEDITHYI